jgi:uncharacterized protein with FMN-binding domain
MRRVVLAFASTVAGLLALLSFKTHTASVAAPPAAVSTVGPGTSSASSASPSPSASAASGTKTVTGDSVSTQWGNVQVQITVTNGKITSATAVDYPQNNGRDQQINAYAIPVLQQESVGATSANIDMVSGATVTSGGYVQSLQSALDKAGL